MTVLDDVTRLMKLCWLGGFEASGEGWNGEMCRDNNQMAEVEQQADEYIAKIREEYMKEFKEESHFGEDENGVITR